MAHILDGPLLGWWWPWKPLHLIGGAHDDVALDDVVDPLLEIGLVDAHDDCLIMALEPWCLLSDGWWWLWRWSLFAWWWSPCIWCGLQPWCFVMPMMETWYVELLLICMWWRALACDWGSLTLAPSPYPFAPSSPYLLYPCASSFHLCKPFLNPSSPS